MPGIDQGYYEHFCASKDSAGRWRWPLESGALPSSRYPESDVDLTEGGHMTLAVLRIYLLKTPVTTRPGTYPA